MCLYFFFNYFPFSPPDNKTCNGGMGGDSIFAEHPVAMREREEGREVRKISPSMSYQLTVFLIR